MGRVLEAPALAASSSKDSSLAAKPAPPPASTGKGAAPAANPAAAAASTGKRGQQAGRGSGEQPGNSSVSCARCRDRPPVCFRCNGLAWKSCSRCNGMGELQGSAECWCSQRRPEAAGKGKGGRAGKGDGRGKGGKAAKGGEGQPGTAGAPAADCRRCHGTGRIEWARPCQRCEGQGLWRCEHCAGRGLFPCGACGRGQIATRGGQRGRGVAGLVGPEPEKGLTVTRCAGTEVEQIRKLWGERGGGPAVTGVWSIENPHLAWQYRRRLAELERELKRPPAELRGFHGSDPRNILSIAQMGFDSGRRCGQAFGAGEYFAKNPSVSIGYCHGGAYMLVCQLCLGIESSTEENLDGDHIWVPGCGYYVISSPAQVLPLYILSFEVQRSAYRAAPPLDELALATALAQPVYRSGGAVDTRMLDLSLEGQADALEALPAAWWSGDVAAFSGEVVFDPANFQGEQPMDRGAVQGKIVLVRRGGSKFAAKAARAREAGAKALLVAHASGQGPLQVMVCPAQSEERLAAAMVDAEAGRRLVELACGRGAHVLRAERRGAAAEPPVRHGSGKHRRAVAGLLARPLLRPAA